MATKKWFVRVGDEEMGPLGPGGLRKMVRRGEIGAETLIRREDHTEAVPAARVRGLLPSQPVATNPRPRHREVPPEIHGPYTSLRDLGRGTAAVMFAFALLGLYGIVVALGQIRNAEAGLDGAPIDPAWTGLPLFGLGVWVILALAFAGGLFLWWLWTARVNLPHLIRVHVRLAPSWTIASWFLPLLNLFWPYMILAEVDRLSAEAEAGGDVTIKPGHGLLGAWWAAALAGTALALIYMFLSPEDAGALRVAGGLHLLAGLATLTAGVLCGWIVLRITKTQERAHEQHPEPVEPRHRLSHARRVRGPVRVAR